MEQSIEIRHGRSCISSLNVHLVFVTKYRRGVISESILSSLTDIFKDVCIKLESELLECNGEDDHVHLLVSYPAKLSISTLVNSLKGVSSRLVRTKHPETRKKLWGNAFWSASYYAGSCGGANLATVQQYVQAQRNKEEG